MKNKSRKLSAWFINLILFSNRNEGVRGQEAQFTLLHRINTLT